MVKILGVKARQVLDSRGFPTVEAEIRTAKGNFSAIVPSGASTGKHEALELRDGGKAYGGKGVLKAVRNVNSVIAAKLVGKEFRLQEDLDLMLLSLDGTPDKSHLGANALLAVSMSFSRALAAEDNIPLYEFIGRLSGHRGFVMPVPLMNVMNGGKHAGRENDIQEHMLVPVEFGTFSEALRAGAETYHVLKGLLKKKFGWDANLLGDEGGFAPKIGALEQRLELMLGAVEDAGYGDKIRIALDCAASEFFSGGSYHIGGEEFSAGELADYYNVMVKRFGIISIEDGFAEDDWSGWKLFTSKLGSKIQIVGDDLLATNAGRIKKAAKENACNALLLKLNQIGTVTESLEAYRLARAAGWNVVVSHRSGETEDVFISDLVVGLCAGQSKFGAPARTDRNAKYNRLLRIEEELLEKGRVSYAGAMPFGES